MDETPFSLDDRILCSDGACIGLVGEDGQCRVCGKVYAGDVSLIKTGAAQNTGGVDPPDDSGPMSGEIEALKKELEEQDLREENENERICCPDDMCIGVIGANGTCGTCGKQA